MPYMTALVDIGFGWPAGESRHVEEGRAARLVNSGWAEPTESEIADDESDETQSATPATPTKEQ